jgi:ribosomal protein L11 methyltransferase
MSWLAATAVVEARHADALSDALLGAGAASSEVSDADAGTVWERPIFEEVGAEAAPGWARARVSALFRSGTNVAAALAQAFRAAGLPPTTAYELSAVEDADWVRASQSQFTPLQITPRLWVVPSWHPPPDPQAVNIVLDPGLAFGTGSHPTTRLALRWLERHVAGGESVIDFGCGSGILAIAALKLGAAHAEGVDIDPQALAAARSNCRRNGARARFVSAAGRLRSPAHLVVANILARPLINLAPLLSKLTRRGGRLALSGILRDQADEVLAAYGAWYDFAEPRAEDEWVLLDGVRR